MASPDHRVVEVSGVPSLARCILQRVAGVLAAQCADETDGGRAA